MKDSASRGRPLIAVVLLAMLLGLAACADESPPEPGGRAGDVLVLALLPDEEAAAQQRKYAPLLDALHARTGLEVKLDLAQSYEDLVERFVAGRVDLAYFGGYTFLAAEERAAAVPLVMRDIDAQFVSYVLVREESDARGLADLAGARFAFGSRSSTSGHVMPRYFFRDMGIDPERFFGSVAYSNAHDLTLQWIRDGTVDAGAVNAQIARDWLSREGAASGLRVIWQSPPYVDYVWAVQPRMSEATRAAIREVFLSLTMDDPASRDFLAATGSRHFLPAHSDDFTPLRDAVRVVNGARTDVQGPGTSR